MPNRKRKVPPSDAPITSQPRPSRARVRDDSTDDENTEIEADIIRIAIFCALVEEVVAVIHSLDEEFTCHPKSTGEIKYVYSFGRIHHHNVVIARPTQIGTVKAAQCAASVSQQFPNIRFALTVGIGAAIPGTKHDIRLGDIAVSMPSDGHPGVVQYDFGKYEQDGFLLKGCLNKPPSILTSADQSVEQDEMLGRSRLGRIVKVITDKPGFHMPDSPDILFHDDFEHVNKRADCSACHSHRKKKVVERAPRSGQHPKVHRGLILSGSGVIKSPRDRKLLRRKYDNALCFEMEAAGIVDEVPCLVVRGISDYADTHKQDEWRKYAAGVAAAYCKTVLCKVNSTDLEVLPTMKDLVKGVSTLVEEIANIQSSQRQVVVLPHYLRTYTLTVNSATQNKIDVVGEAINLSALSIAKGASFDSYESQNDEFCLSGTRTEVLRDIHAWARDPHGHPIFWLSGRAGTGKSTVSRTLAKAVRGNKEVILGANFFFKRGEGDRGNARKLFPTIVGQLASIIPQLKLLIAEAINSNPEICGTALGEQFDRLVLQPLLRLTEPVHQTILVVIDALDECETDEEIGVVLRLLSEIRRIQSLRVRVFVTSRPELHIRVGFKEMGDNHQSLVLHDIPHSIIRKDIALLIEHKINAIKKNRSLPPEWPGADSIQTLIDMSVPLFIFAATVCRTLQDPQWEPQEALSDIINHQTDHSVLSRAYGPSLNRLLVRQRGKRKARLIEEYQLLLGTIILLEDPLPIGSLSELLGIPKAVLRTRLDLLHSVLNIPSDETLPVRVFHKSFRDFLLGSETATETAFWVDEKGIQEKIAIRCIQTMCSVFPGKETKRLEIDEELIQHRLSSEVRYSCRYWVHHLVHGNNPKSLVDDALGFLRVHFLHWVEAMSLMEIPLEPITIINILRSAVGKTESSDIAAFLYDARRFLLHNSHIVNEIPLQLYASGLVFTPEESIIRKTFLFEVSPLLCQLPKGEKDWGPELQALCGHSDQVNGITMSPNGPLIASCSTDTTIKLWDSETGALKQTLVGHSASVCCVSFSVDGRLLASGSEDKTIKVWCVATGELKYTLEGHLRLVKTLVFSADSLFSGSPDTTIRIWDLKTGTMDRVLGHKLSRVQLIKLSPCGELLASLHTTNEIKIWDIASGAKKHSLGGSPNPSDSEGSGELELTSFLAKHMLLIHTDTYPDSLEASSHLFKSMAFVPNTRRLATISGGRHRDGIHIWNIETGTIELVLDGASFSAIRFCSMAFSPDNQLVACNDTRFIRLFDATTGKPLQTFRYPPARYVPQNPQESDPDIAFSPDIRMVISASGAILKLWDCQIRGLPQSGSQDQCGSIVFSPDGKYLASMSRTKFFSVWSANPFTLKLSFHNQGSFEGSEIIFTPDSENVVTHNLDQLLLWDCATGSLRQTFKFNRRIFSMIVFSPDSRLLAVSNEGCQDLEIWDTVTGSRRHVLDNGFSGITSIIISGDSRLLASGHKGEVNLWDTDTADCLGTWSVNGSPYTMGFSPTEPYLQTSNQEICIDKWYTPTGRTDHQETTRVSIQDGEWLAVDGRRRLWLPPDYQNCYALFRGSIFVTWSRGELKLMEFDPRIPEG